MPLNATDRLVGAGLGQAIGDFLGFQVERGPGDRALAFACRVVEDASGQFSLRDSWPIGQVSDDTQMSLKLLAHLRPRGGEGAGFDADAFSRELAAGRDSYVGMGKGTAKVLTAIAEGTPWREASKLNAAPTNGGAMRVWPLAFSYSGVELVRAAMSCAAITHSHPAAQQAAACVAYAVRHVADGGSHASILLAMRQLSRNFGISVAGAIADHVDRCLEHPESALSSTWALSGGAEQEWRHVSPLAVPTVVWALFSFVRAEGNLVEAALQALSAGGDVDSVAAIACTLCGAMGGPSAAPPRLVALARDGDFWNGDGLRRALAGATEGVFEPS